MTPIEILARGVCTREGMLLLCHGRGASNTYLPGGHVEFMERAADALERELLEELGLQARAGGFLGAVEHTFLQKGKRHCEINLVFKVDIEGIDVSSAPRSAEANLDFLWVPLAGLEQSELEPQPLRQALVAWLKHGKIQGRWASTYPPPAGKRQ